MVGYKNDTNYVIVVQTAVVVNNTVTKKGKPQMLYPGEVALDGQSGTGVRRITIYDPKKYDPKKPNTPLHEEDVIIKKDMFFLIKAEKSDNLPVKNPPPPPPPKFKLEATALPSMPPNPGATKPGTTQPKKP
jgi:hypothetical protein